MGGICCEDDAERQLQYSHTLIFTMHLNPGFLSEFRQQITRPSPTKRGHFLGTTRLGVVNEMYPPAMQTTAKPWAQVLAEGEFWPRVTYTEAGIIGEDLGATIVVNRGYFTEGTGKWLPRLYVFEVSHHDNLVV